MKASTKALIAFIIIAVIGLGLTIGGALKEKVFLMDIYKVITDPTYGYTTQEYKEEEGENVNKVNIDAPDIKVVVREGEEFKVVITTRGKAGEHVYQDGVFAYKQKKVIASWFFKPNNIIEVTLPSGRQMDLDVATALDIDIQGCETIGELKLKSNVGNLKIHDVNANNIDANNTSGSVSVKNCVSQDKFVANVLSGNMVLANVNALTIDLENMSGKISVEGAKADSLKMANASGDVIASDIEAKTQINAKSISGDVELNALKCKEILAKASSGDIQINQADISECINANSASGTIALNKVSNCNMDLQTASGDVIIKLYNAQISLNASTSSGKIYYLGEKQGSTFNHQTDSQYKIIAKSSSGDIQITVI